MQDSHRNIFFSYSQGGYENVEEEKVLEDNVTKAFINTLEYIDEHTRKTILSKIISEDKIGNGSLQFDLQRLNNEIIKKKLKDKVAIEKYVLIITPNGKKDLINPKSSDIFKKFSVLISQHKDEREKIRKQIKELSNKIVLNDQSKNSNQKLLSNFLKNHSINTNIEYLDSKAIYTVVQYLYELTKGSRPDAWIMIGNKIIMMENKIKGKVFNYQIERHINDHFKSGVNKKIKKTIIKSWAEIYKIFDKHKNHFLIEQFLDYLKECDLSTIEFTQQTFNSFSNRDEDSKKNMKNIHHKLFAFIEEINNDLFPEMFTIVEGARRDFYLGVELIPNELKELSSSQLVHLSVGLENEKIRVYISILNKSLTETLSKKIGNDKTFNNELQKSLKLLPTLKFSIKPKIRLSEKLFLDRGRDQYLDGYVVEINDKYNDLNFVADYLENINKKTKTDLRMLYPQYKHSSFTGVFQIEYQLLSLLVIKMDENIKGIVAEALTNLIPTFNILSESLNPPKFSKV